MESEITQALQKLHRTVGRFGEYEIFEVWCSTCGKTVIQNPSVEWIRNSPSRCEKCGAPLLALVNHEYGPTIWTGGIFLLATIKRDMEQEKEDN